MEKYFLVLLGGAIGSLARYLAASAIMNRYPGRFPLGTLVVNVTGCFLIGVILTSITQKTQPSPNWQLFLVVGLLGGYTTFSGFAWEIFTSARNGSPWIGLINLISSVILGYFAVWLGVISANRR
jgi:CrcB protein